MNSEADTEQHQHEHHEDTKVELTISTLSGDFTHEFESHQKLQVVVEQAAAKLELEGDGPWILEHEGKELSLQDTIAQSQLKSGDVLTLSPEEGGGASKRQ